MDNLGDNIKNILKTVLKSILRSKIFILTMILILVLGVLLPACVYYITLDDAEYKEGDSKSTPYVSSTYTGGAKVSTAGITTQTMAEEHWKELVEAGGNVRKYLDNEEELEKLMNAEIMSQLPQIPDAKTEINGIVKFHRYKSNGDFVLLTYVEPATFDSYMRSGNIEVQNCYTLDEDRNLLIATVSETIETLTSNDDKFNISEYSRLLSESNLKSDGTYERITYNIDLKKINYLELIKKYTMPFQFLWALIVTGEDKGVALELAELVKDNKIVVSIYDNVTTTTKESIFTYNRGKKVDVSATATCHTNYGDFSASGSKLPADNWQEGSYEIKRVVTYKSNSFIVDVSKADVWSVDYTRSYNRQADTNIRIEENEKDLSDTEYVVTSDSSSTGGYIGYEEEIQRFLSSLANDATVAATESVVEEVVNNVIMELVIDEVSITECTKNFYEKNINRHQKDTTTTSVQEYTPMPAINNPKIQRKTKKEIEEGTGEDNFVTILCDAKHDEARYKIAEEIPSWLFQILESNPDTKDMVEITKFLLNAVTNNVSYEVTEDDFNSYYETTGFSEVIGAVTGGTIQEKVWKGLKNLGYSDIAVAGAMGNIHFESGSFSPYAVESGYTEDTGGIGICQWTNNHRGTSGRNAQLKAFATSRGLTWKDENIQVEFLIGELTIGGGADGYASYQLADTTELYRSSLACASQWINAENVENATQAFCYSFERPKKEAAEASMSARISYANQYYIMYAGK